MYMQPFCASGTASCRRGEDIVAEAVFHEDNYVAEIAFIV